MRKQCKRYDNPGQAHFLTFSCFRRQPFLTGDMPPRWLAESIEDAKQKVPFDLWAYVFMPDHVHLLVWPKNGTKVSDILKWVKQPVAVRTIRYVKDNAPNFLERMKDARPDGRFSYRFWQRGGGYDRNLWNGKDIRTKINYIHDNPVRQGLVESPSDWKWGSFNAWENGDYGFPRTDKDSLFEVFP